MKTTMALLVIAMLATQACSERPSQDPSISDAAPSPPASLPAVANAPSWEIGEDIAGKNVMIDGKQEVIPDDVADAKRKMDAVAKEKLDEMDALERQRLARFKDPDMKP